MPTLYSLSFQDISTSTQIPAADLTRTLQSLACGKYRILTKYPKSREVATSDSFAFNDGFTAPLAKIKIAMVVNRVETGEERSETVERVDEERRHLAEVSWSFLSSLFSFLPRWLPSRARLLTDCRLFLLPFDSPGLHRSDPQISKDHVAHRVDERGDETARWTVPTYAEYDQEEDRGFDRCEYNPSSSLSSLFARSSRGRVTDSLFFPCFVIFFPSESTSNEDPT